MNPQSLTLLLVEDNGDDVFLMERALKKASISAPMHVVMDGQQALDYLGGKGKYADRAQHPVPSVIFLDLKLPYLDGFEVLEWLSGQPALQHLPVIVLTSSPEERDQNRARQLGAKAYLVKPPSGEMLVQVLRLLNENERQAVI